AMSNIVYFIFFKKNINIVLEYRIVYIAIGDIDLPIFYPDLLLCTLRAFIIITSKITDLCAPMSPLFVLPMHMDWRGLSSIQTRPGEAVKDAKNNFI
ncbi:hypothetical protein ACJX0J_030378, partial [Zea mays]